MSQPVYELKCSGCGRKCWVYGTGEVTEPCGFCGKKDGFKASEEKTDDR